MKIYIVLLLLIGIGTGYSKDNSKTNVQVENIQEIKEDPNAKLRTDTVSFALTTSLLGVGYFEGDAGLLSQTSLDMFVGTPKSRFYLYLTSRVITPIISPMPNNIFAGTSFLTGIGFGNWVYKNLNENKKGWLVGLNMGLLSHVYNSFVAKEGKGTLNGWGAGIELTINMRAIYQLNRDFGFVIGTDISYYFPWSFITGLEERHSLTGGITMGIAF